MLGKSVVPQNFHDISKIFLGSSRVYYLQLGECKPSSRSRGFSCSFTARPQKRGIFSLKAHAASAETDQPKWWEKNAGPNMIDIHSTQEFVDALSQAGDRLVIVDFFGTWCASCRALFPKICRIAGEHPEIIFLKLQKLKDAIAVHNKACHSNSPLDSNGAVVDSQEVSVSPDDNQL